ncbi:ADP-glyceromanno-heptose 6-epimerase [soil metagenome]
MIVITGAAGFIGSCVAERLYAEGKYTLLLVDDFEREDKLPNLAVLKQQNRMHRNEFLDWLSDSVSKVEMIIHLGARTDTTEFNTAIFDELNLNYSKALWQLCTQRRIPLIYASSAATYGLGELGFDDDHRLIPSLKPLNPYGQSKQDFDVWALKQTEQPPFWAGLKFFNVYGPHESHKGRMASVVFHAYKQIKETGQMTLFRSHNAEYKDGEQLRDFIYVSDLVDVILWLMDNKPASAIYNLGPGKARTFIDLTKATFEAMGLEMQINFRDTPEDIRDKYQYFTQARMNKLRMAGYKAPFKSLEEGVSLYVEWLLGIGA